MNTLLEANIFFVVTTVAVIVLTAFLVVALIYVIRVIKDLSHITTIARKESDEIVKNIAEARNNFKEQVHGWKSATMLFLKWLAPRHRPTKKKAEKGE